MTNQTIFPFETTKARLLFVVVPSNANSLRLSVINNRQFLGHGIDTKFLSDWKPLPHGEWQLLGTGDLNEVTEEQAASLFPYKRVENIGLMCYLFDDPDGLSHTYLKAKPALKSLARSLGIPEDKKTIVLADFKK